MRNARIYVLFLCLFLASCLNKIRDDGSMAFGDGFYPMIYFESNEAIQPFLSEVVERFGPPNGEAPRIKRRLVWEELEHPDLFDQPVRMVIDTSRRGDKGYFVSIAMMDQNEENLLVKKTAKQQSLKRYFQAIIDEQLR